jgi:general L-amino acid transport system permease protein
MEAYVQKTPTETLKPPVTSVGAIGWARANLFNGWLNSLLTIVTLYFLWIVVPPLIRWTFIDSVWNTTGAVCRDADGACWSIIATNFRFILFGFFPYDQQWRPLIAMLMLFGLLFYSRNRNHWTQHLLYAWISGLVLMGVLMRGGIFWLSSVEPTQWGGLPLTLLLSVFGLTAAYPLGVILGAPVQNADHQVDVYRLH